MIGRSDEQILEYFKETFQSKRKSKLLEMYDTDTAIVKDRDLVQLFKV